METSQPIPRSSISPSIQPPPSTMSANSPSTSPVDFTLKRLQSTAQSRPESLHVSECSRPRDSRPTWSKLSTKKLLMAIHALALVSIFFEGYDQGVMGGVNSSPDYIDTVGLASHSKHHRDLDVLKQGGIVAIFYVGCVIGAVSGGWVADSIGRVRGLFCFVIFSIVGGALQAAAQNLAFMLVSRVISGIGIGAITSITPVWVSELSPAPRRGAQIGYVFVANYLGIATAYWLSFGLSFIKGGHTQFRWRFILGFQCAPAILLLAFILFLPDSPRYLSSVGRNDEAWEVLMHVRDPKTPKAVAQVHVEFSEIVDSTRSLRHSNPLDMFRLFAGALPNKKRLTRRAWLAFFLQIMAEWTGITLLTVSVSELLAQAGFAKVTVSGLSGGINSIGIIGTIISAQLVDRMGRRKNLIWGALGLAVVNFACSALLVAQDRATDHSQRLALASGATVCLFAFNLIYASSWGTTAFLYPTEIFPAEMRAQGNAFGILGWAVGCGVTTLVNPSILSALRNNVYFLFGSFNLLWAVIVYLVYPEPARRPLERVEALFTPSLPWSWEAERAYKERHGDDDSEGDDEDGRMSEGTDAPQMHKRGDVKKLGSQA